MQATNIELVVIIKGITIESCLPTKDGRLTNRQANRQTNWRRNEWKRSTKQKCGPNFLKKTSKEFIRFKRELLLYLSHKISMMQGLVQNKGTSTQTQLKVFSLLITTIYHTSLILWLRRTKTTQWLCALCWKMLNHDYWNLLNQVSSHLCFFELFSSKFHQFHQIA